MPVNRSLYRGLKKQYGPKKAGQVYYAMENKSDEKFRKGLKTATKEGHTMKRIPKPKK